MQIYYDEKNNEVVLNKREYDDETFSNHGLFEEKFPLGYLLVGFIELDFDKIAHMVENELTLSMPRNAEDALSNIEKIERFFNELKNVHAYFWDNHHDIEESFDLYIYEAELHFQIKSLLLKDADWFDSAEFQESIVSGYSSSFYGTSGFHYPSSFLISIFNIKNNPENISEAISAYIKEHPLSDVFIQEFRDKLNNIIETGKWFKKAVEFCLDSESPLELRNLSPLHRYYLFQKYINKGVQYYCIPTTYQINSIDDESHESWEELPDFDESRFDEIIKSLPKEPINLYEVYDVNVGSACYFEFMKLVSKGTRLNKCKNCGRYFINTGRADTKYCDRALGGDGKTCKDVGAMNLYREKTKNDPVVEEYNRAYKRRFAQVKHKKLSNQEFERWSMEARVKKEKAKAGKISIDEFKNWLGNK